MNPSKQKYEALLGVMADTGDLRILCSYEYHASEPGWHCHSTHDEVSTVPTGVMRGPWVKRLPRPRNLHRANKHPKFTIQDEDAAVRFAIDRYNIEAKGPLL